MSSESSPSASDLMNGELRALEERLVMWKRDYLDHPPTVRAREYQAEVEEVVLPYLARLRTEELITSAELVRMTDFIDRQIECLRSTTSGGA